MIVTEDYEYVPPDLDPLTYIQHKLLAQLVLLKLGNGRFCCAACGAWVDASELENFEIDADAQSVCVFCATDSDDSLPFVVKG